MLDEDLRMSYNLPEEERSDRNRGRSVSEAGMKDGVVLFIVCVLVIAGIGIWSSGVDPFTALPTPTLRSEPWVVEGNSSRLNQPAKAKPTPNIAKSLPVKAAVPIPEPIVEPAPIAVAEIPAPAPPPKEFPIADQIRAGVGRTQITEQFGAPALVTTTKDDGHVVENLIYTKSGGAGETVIRVQDGKVLSAYSR